MKYAFLILSLLFAQAGFANPVVDPCLETLEKKFVTDSKSQDWGYDRIVTLSHKDAKVMIKEALAEDEERDRPVMAAFVGKKDVLFYVLAWTAVANSGTTLIAADKSTCTVLEDLLYWSEE